MTNYKYITNAFSLQMLADDTCTINVKPVTKLGCDLASIPSAVGHPDTAAVLGVECNRINVKVGKGEKVIVAQLMGGRLPEGCTTLPDGFEFKYFSVEIS